MIKAFAKTQQELEETNIQIRHCNTWFDGWRDYVAAVDTPLPEAKSWLIETGWKQYHALIPINQAPS